jgi:hypothetical protein
VFKWDDIKSSWSQLGDDIDGEFAGDTFGRSLSMSMDGMNIAIGGRRNDGNGIDSGNVRVYKWSETNAIWSQVGNDIDGEATGDQSGYSVSLSGDGSSVAIAAPYNGGNGINAGHVRVFKFFQMPSYEPTSLPSQNPSVRCLNKCVFPPPVDLLTYHCFAPVGSTISDSTAFSKLPNEFEHPPRFGLCLFSCAVILCPCLQDVSNISSNSNPIYCIIPVIIFIGEINVWAHGREPPVTLIHNHFPFISSHHTDCSIRSSHVDTVDGAIPFNIAFGNPFSKT